MKVAGKFLRNRRLRYAMSQRQLASGICAQATISLIENQDSCPNLGILTKVCRRLRTSVFSIVKTGRGVTSIERLILNRDYQRAALFCNRISQRQFKCRHQMKCYFCYQGVFSMVNANYFDAVYYCNRVLDLHCRNHNDFYRSWAYLNLGYIYFKQNDGIKSREFLQLARRGLNNQVNLKADVRFRLFVKLRLRLSKLYEQLDEYRKAKAVNLMTISRLVKNHSMYGLARAYVQLSVNFKNLDSSYNANLALTRAKLVRNIYRDSRSLRISE